MTINDWRTEIDNVDNEILRLLNQRVQLAAMIGSLKRAANLPLNDFDRERSLLTRLRHINVGPLDDQALALIFQRIIFETRRLEEHAIAPEARSGRPHCGEPTTTQS
jgi:chorismate mutase / prephenate dehydratase